MKTGLDNFSCKHYKGSRFRVLGLFFSCFCMLLLIVFNTNCYSTQVLKGFEHKEVVSH
jgi:hypothetical protein